MSGLRRFVTEPVILAMFGELLQPPVSVEYVIPLSTIYELHDFRREQFIEDHEYNQRIQQQIEKLIRFFETPFIAKKLQRLAAVPWRSSSPMIWSEHVTFTVVHGLENEEYGELFDPVETELILIAQKQDLPLLSEDASLQNRIVEYGLPVQVFDVKDFAYALEFHETETAMAEEKRPPAQSLLSRLKRWLSFLSLRIVLWGGMLWFLHTPS